MIRKSQKKAGSNPLPPHSPLCSLPTLSFPPRLTELYLRYKKNSKFLEIYNVEEEYRMGKQPPPTHSLKSLSSSCLVWLHYYLREELTSVEDKSLGKE
jgi:hypothetical protein